MDTQIILHLLATIMLAAAISSDTTGVSESFIKLSLTAGLSNIDSLWYPDVSHSRCGPLSMT